MIDVLIIRVPLRSDPSHTMFLEEDGKKENFNFPPFRNKLKFQIFSGLKFCFKILKF